MDGQHRLTMSRDGQHCTLHDVVADPVCKRNIAGDNPKRVAEMRDDLLQWKASVIDSWRGKDYKQDGR